MDDNDDDDNDDDDDDVDDDKYGDDGYLTIYRDDNNDVRMVRRMDKRRYSVVCVTWCCWPADGFKLCGLTQVFYFCSAVYFCSAKEQVVWLDSWMTFDNIQSPLIVFSIFPYHQVPLSRRMRFESLQIIMGYVCNPMLRLYRLIPLK